MSEQRFVRIPTAAERSGLSRSKLYEIAQDNRGLFRKVGAATMVDLKMLDRVIGAFPAAELGKTKEQAAARTP
jgi:hypothetical protein